MNLMKNIQKTAVILLLCVVLSGCSPSDLRIWWADCLSGLSGSASAASVRLYEAALKGLAPGEARQKLCLKLGTLYLEKGDYDKAAGYLKFCPWPQQGLWAEALYKKGDYTQALDVFNRVGENGPPRSLYYYALTLEHSNLHDAALKLYERLRQDPVYGRQARERMAQINLFAGVQAYAGLSPQARELIEKSPKAEAYPDASALYLLADESETLTPERQLVSEQHYLIKILNDRGKENFGEVTIPYDSTYETVDLEYARTVKPDGTVVTVGDKNIRDVSMYLNFPMYSNARARIISMPEVAPGSVLEYKVRVYRTKLVNGRDFDSLYWLQADEPLILQKFRITLPGDVALRTKVVNDEYNPDPKHFSLMPQRTDRAGEVTYDLEIRDVPQIIPEPAMPALSKIDPYLAVSTFTAWKEIYEWWKPLYLDKLTADDDMKNKVDELTKGKATRKEKIAAIYGFCAQDIRYVGVEYGDAGYEPHDAREIFRNKYGDCKDKSILLIALLKIAGIEAYPVLISTRDHVDISEDLPCLMFNHAITAVVSDKDLIFMDATASTVSFGDLPEDDQDRRVLVFYPDHYEFVRTPLFDPEHNRVLKTTRIRVKDDESILGERTVETWGSFRQVQRYWAIYTMPTLLEETIKQRVRSIAENGILLSYSIKNAQELEKPIDFSYRFSASRYFIDAGPIRLMDQTKGIDTSVVASEKRRYPLETGGLRTDEEVLEVELPASFAVKYLPQAVSIDAPWFSLESGYKTQGRTLLYTTRLRVKRREVSREEYPEYKKIMEELASRLNQQVILETKRK